MDTCVKMESSVSEQGNHCIKNTENVTTPTTNSIEVQVK